MLSPTIKMLRSSDLLRYTTSKLIYQSQSEQSTTGTKKAKVFIE